MMLIYAERREPDGTLQKGVFFSLMEFANARQVDGWCGSEKMNAAADAFALIANARMAEATERVEPADRMDSQAGGRLTLERKRRTDMNDGGPAFPRNHALKTCIEDGERTTIAEGHNSGMSLRDWFAGQAISTFVNCDLYYGTNEKPESPWPWVAKECYLAADALLAERDKTKESL